MTIRESAAEMRRESESRFRLASRAAFEAIWDSDVRTDATSWSEGLRAVFGYLPGEVGRGASWWSERVHPDDRDRVVKGYEAVLSSTGHEWSDEYRFRRKDGSYSWVTDRAYVERDRDGRALRVVGAMMDVTERKRAEDELALRARQQAAVARLGLSALAGTGLQALFDETVRLVRETLCVQISSVMELLPGGRSLRVTAGAGCKPGVVGHLVIGTEESHAGMALRSHGPIVIADLATNPRL